MKFLGHSVLAAAPAAKDLATPEGTNDLIFYLIVRFIAVLLVVMAAESLMVWVESVALLPALRWATTEVQSAEPQATTSLIALVHWLFLLVKSMAQADYLRMASFAHASLVLMLIFMALVLPALPPLAGALAFAHVVAGRVQALQRQRERELRQIDQQRNQFMTDIAHDLRTPLMAISGMAHALSDGVVPDETQRDDYLRSIGAKADKLGELVSKVFEYTKLGSDAYVLERTDVDLPQLLLREAAVVYTDIEEAGLLFSVQVPEDRCMVHADPVQLARVVSNLLTNALRHNGPGTEIALLLVRQAGVAYVIVADAGDPIAGNPDDLFQPFSRGDAARRDTGGSGLGLSICKRIAERHGYGLQLVQPYGRFAKAFVLQCTVAE